MTDSAGQVVWEGEFKPFGEAINITGSITNNLRFPGQYYDEETGLHYNYFRDYNPVIGRYIQADPIGIQQAINHLFTYVGNNPVINIDPQGLFPWEPDIPICAPSPGMHLWSIDFTSKTRKHEPTTLGECKCGSIGSKDSVTGQIINRDCSKQRGLNTEVITWTTKIYSKIRLDVYLCTSDPVYACQKNPEGPCKWQFMSSTTYEKLSKESVEKYSYGYGAPTS